MKNQREIKDSEKSTQEKTLLGLEGLHAFRFFLNDVLRVGETVWSLFKENSERT